MIVKMKMKKINENNENNPKTNSKNIKETIIDKIETDPINDSIEKSKNHKNQKKVSFED